MRWTNLRRDTCDTSHSSSDKYTCHKLIPFPCFPVVQWYWKWIIILCKKYGAIAPLPPPPKLRHCTLDSLKAGVRTNCFSIKQCKKIGRRPPPQMTPLKLERTSVDITPNVHLWECMSKDCSRCISVECLIDARLRGGKRHAKIVTNHARADQNNTT